MLTNKKIVLVGGGTGIGQAIAQKAIDAGAEVVIASRSLEKLRVASTQLGECVQMAQVDASDEQSVIDFFKESVHLTIWR